MKIRHEVIFQDELCSLKDSGRSHSLKINQYLLFSWAFCWGIAVNIAVFALIGFWSGTWVYLELGVIILEKIQIA
jgi:hypothetical protein